MRKSLPIAAAGMACVVLLSGCGHRGYDRSRPDEFAVARQPPLVIPPDYALVPPKAGAAPARTGDANAQTLQAMFGGASGRSASESATVTAAGGDTDDSGVRSDVGDTGTSVVDKGAATRDIVAAPQGDGQDARASTTAANTGSTTTSTRRRPH